jgi:hypothetical protein
MFGCAHVAAFTWLAEQARLHILCILPRFRSLSRKSKQLHSLILHCSYALQPLIPSCGSPYFISSPLFPIAIVDMQLVPKELSAMGSKQNLHEASLSYIVPTKSSWESYRQEIRQLYIVEDRPLREVMDRMKQEHGLLATAKMYKSRLAKWHFVKNNNSEEMESILRELIEQNIVDQDASYRVNGKLIEVKEVARYFRRKGFPNL